MRNPLLCRAARPESGREARESLLWAARSNSGRAAPSACVGKRFSAAQIIWNRSTRRTGARGGARVDRPRWLRILTITGGSSMAVLRRRLRTGDDLQSAAAVRAVFDVEDLFEQPGPAHGYVPQYLYDRAGIDTSLPFEELKRRSRVNPAAQAANQAPDFSQRISVGLPNPPKLALR
jgi:hypothetical protein